MRYLVDPQSLVFNSKRINGFVEFITDNDVKQWDLLSIATDVASEKFLLSLLSVSLPFS